MKPLLGKPIASVLIGEGRHIVKEQQIVPGLAVILVGEDQASLIYVDLKERAAEGMGIYFEKQLLAGTSTTEAVLETILQLNQRADINGIIVQLPLPDQIDTDRVIAAIDPAKDADGFHPETIRRFLADEAAVAPVFPRAVRSLIESSGVELHGKRALIFANSELFSQVMEVTLERIGIVVESRLTPVDSIGESTFKDFDIIVLARGEPHFLKISMVKPGAIIIDGGITRVGEVVMSDADPSGFDSLPGYLTPVPGGVGPVTVATLLRHVIELTLDCKNRRIL